VAEEDQELYEDCQDDESFTFVIDEEMIQFLETSAKHKLELSESKYTLGCSKVYIIEKPVEILEKKKDAEELEASEELVKGSYIS
jgi:hypothetical protein